MSEGIHSVRSAHRRGRGSAASPWAAAEALQGLLSGLVKQRGVQHAVMHVESGDGSFAWSGGVGEASLGGTPMTPETPHAIASITKLYTATLAMLLVEDGRLALDAPVREYLPSGYAKGIHRRRGVDASHRVTMRNLLAHTSGLPNYVEDAPKGGRSLSARIFAEGDRAYADEDALRDVRSLEAHFEPQPPVARRIRYSDTNYWLLGLIIEKATGMPLERAYETMILRPLGLRHTYLFGRSEPLEPGPDMAVVWLNDRPMDFPRFMRSHAADGGLVATTGDTIAFLRALHTGAIFRKPDTYRSMLQQTSRFGFPTDAAALRAPSWPIECGLGILRFQLPRLLNDFRHMPTLVGHTGSTGSWLFHCPEWDLYLAGTVDQATAGALPYRIVPRLLRALDPLRRA